MATRAIDKGMPIEQVQKLLGHSTIETTMEYALVNQQNVKNSHCAERRQDGCGSISNGTTACDVMISPASSLRRVLCQRMSVL